MTRFPAPLPLAAPGVRALGTSTTPEPPGPMARAAPEAPVWGWQSRTVGICSLVGLASPGAPAPLPTVVSFLRNLSPSGPHVLLVGMSGAQWDSAPAQSNGYQR